MITHLQLADSGLVEVLRGRVDACGDEIAAVDMFFLHAAFAFFDAGRALLLELPGLALLLGLASFEGHVLVAGARRAEDGDAEGAQIRAAGSSRGGEFAMATGPQHAGAAGLAGGTGALVM